MTARTLTYYTPQKVKFSGKQMESIVRDNMETWNLERSDAEDCNDEDVILAATRLGFVDPPEGTIYADPL